MTLQRRMQIRRLKTDLGIATLVLLVVFLALISTAVAREVTAAPPAPSAPIIQAGTVEVTTGGDTDGFAYIDYDFPQCDNIEALQCPVIVATLSEQVAAKYVYARSLSDVRGTIAIKLDAPANYPIMVNWVATLPTERGTAVDGGER